MWTCMEDAYKKKITETVARQKEVAGKVNVINIVMSQVVCK